MMVVVDFLRRLVGWQSHGDKRLPLLAYNHPCDLAMDVPHLYDSDANFMERLLLCQDRDRRHQTTDV